MQIYGLKNCDTCRKAKAFYQADGVIDVRVTPVPGPLLEHAYEQFGDSLVNKSSKTWREMAADDKNLPIISMIRAHPSVMKRPLMVMADGALELGFKPR